MLFCNIDHLDSRLVPMTRVAGYQFFIGASSLDMMLGHMEFATDPDPNVQNDPTPPIQQQVFLAAWHATRAGRELKRAAERFLDLSQTVGKDFTHINSSIIPSVFDDAARRIDIPPDSAIAREMAMALLQHKIEGVLDDLATNISEVAVRVGLLGSRILDSAKIQDPDYDEAHLILGRWHPLVVRGQFLSSVCYLSAAVVTA